MKLYTLLIGITVNIADHCLSVCPCPLSS